MFWGNDRLEDALAWAQQGRSAAAPRPASRVGLRPFNRLMAAHALEQGRAHRFSHPFSLAMKNSSSLARRAHAGRPFVHPFRAARIRRVAFQWKQSGPCRRPDLPLGKREPGGG